MCAHTDHAPCDLRFLDFAVCFFHYWTVPNKLAGAPAGSVDTPCNHLVFSSDVPLHCSVRTLRLSLLVCAAAIGRTKTPVYGFVVCALGESLHEVCLSTCSSQFSVLVSPCGQLQPIQRRQFDMVVRSPSTRGRRRPGTSAQPRERSRVPVFRGLLLSPLQLSKIPGLANDKP